MADTPQESAMKAESEKPRPYGTGYKLIGRNYKTPDLAAKVTGRSKYAEDFRAEGMLFCRLVLSPMPHGRIRHIDASDALAMPGVKAVLTADDIPTQADFLADNGQTIKANKWGERALTNEPMFQGDPILAVAAVDELTCAEAIEKIKIDMEPLPFVIDPLDSLRPGGPNPHEDGNVWTRGAAGQEITELKWTKDDFSEFDQGRLPMGKPTADWSYGDVDAGFRDAALVLDESFVTPDVSHQCLEPRTAMAFWQNGKLYLHTGTQSTFQTVPADRALDESERRPGCSDQRVHRRRFWQQGHRLRNHDYPGDPVAQLNAPVMMRISREEEHYIGRARPAVLGAQRSVCERRTDHGARLLHRDQQRGL
jgi:xanthine dehydrogenase molybdenum-binding subunit